MSSRLPPEGERKMCRRVLAALLSAVVIAAAATRGEACPRRPAAEPPRRAASREAGTAPIWDPGGTFSHLVSMNVSTYDNECNEWLTPDESELFFIRLDGANGPADPAHQGDWDIYRSEWDPLNRTWGPPTNLGPTVNTAGSERRPTTTATGDTLFYTSAGKICVSVRTGGIFGPGDTLFVGSNPCISSDTQRIYFGRADDIWVAERVPGGSITEWENLHEVPGAVNTPFAESHPFISWDGTRLFFSDFENPRPGGFGEVDIWVSTWNGSAWGIPENVGPPLNVDMRSCTPWLSRDGRRFCTASEAFEGSRGEEDLWMAYLDSTLTPSEVTHEPGVWAKLGELEGAWNVYDLAVDAGGHLFAATSPEARVFRSGDGGQSWNPTAPLPGAMIAYSLLVGSNGAIYVGTYPNGDVFASTTGGASWTPTGNLPEATAVRALVQLSNGVILAGTSPECTVFATADGGLNWYPSGTTIGLEAGILDLFESSTGRVLLGAQGHPNFSDDGGRTWYPATIHQAGDAEPRVHAFLELAPDTLLACGNLHACGGRVWRSPDGGANWFPITAGDGQFYLDSLRVIQGFDLVETPRGDVLMGIEPGPDRVAMRSGDGGRTWEAEGELTGAVEMLRFLRLGDGTIYAATSPNGDIFRWTPEASGVGGPKSGARPQVAAVIGNFPNPLVGSTSIRWQIPSDGYVRLRILDGQGRRVRTLLNGRERAGQHDVRWNARDYRGAPVESGVYFARLDACGSVTFQKLTVLR